MPLYEHIFLVRQDVPQQQVEGLTEELKALIAKNGGSVSKVEDWGLKSLAYRIKKNRKAYFMLMNIDAPPATLAELERQLSLNEDILRFMTVTVDAHETGPSAMLRKRDDSDKDDRFGAPMLSNFVPPPRGERPARRPRDDFQAGAF